MRALVFERFGDPEDVLQLYDVPVPEPGRNQVRVRMLASPVNPSDLLVVRGQYGRLPTLPATPGFEGVGVVEAAGPGLLWRLRLRHLGRRVAVLNSGGGNWQEQVVLPVRQVVPLPDTVPDEQAASFFVNPATAYALTRRILAVPPGEWLLQTAAAGALARMVIRLGRKYGFRTANVIRRAEREAELRALGADAVLSANDGRLEERVQSLTNGQGVRYALDAVGGSTATEVVSSLAYGGRLVLYGTLSGEPLRLDPRQLMVRQLRVDGFWLSNWVRSQGPVAMLRLFRCLTRLIGEGVLTTDVAGSFPLAQWRDALGRAKAGAGGKVLLRME